MNAKELRTAAEYILNEADFIDQADAYAEQLAYHILATVKEDDDEPIDSTWLAENYKENIFRKDSYSVAIHLLCLLNNGAWEIWLTGWGRIIGVVKTRGQLRRLLEALGVKE